MSTTAPPFPSFTKTWHTTSYPSISPSQNPTLSFANKTVLITGGGSGIGARTVRSFAEAGAANIAILGRRENNLLDVKEAISKEFPKVKIQAYPTDITHKASVDAAFEAYVATAGKIDVLISNAGYGAIDPVIKEMDPETWFAALDVNIKGSFLVTQAFLRSAKEDAVIVNVSSGFSFWKGANVSSYAVSKEAMVRFFEIIQLENPGIRVISLQPGVIETDMGKKSGVPGMDDVSLPADFMVWAASLEGTFLKGKYVFANWDVDEMKEKSEEIMNSRKLQMWLYGLPYENPVSEELSAASKGLL